MRNIALKLMYNGTAYHGWQMQRTEASVQETLQRGLSMVCGERVRLTGVGRTDAGVHAERMLRISARAPASPSTACPSPSTPTRPRTSWCARRWRWRTNSTPSARA